jgi:hypothetical protein
VTSGNGADDIVLGDWITGGDAAEVLDFAAQDDSLLFVWDDSVLGAYEPDVSVSSNPNTVGRFEVRMGENIIAQVQSDAPLTSSDISLIPLSSAQSLGLR